ncbi:MAG TPA: outer membrane beta-barrel protein [Sphingomonas sp.]|nr:outer membrane beta-barrel protein [Sphingomonas sp.]
MRTLIAVSLLATTAVAAPALAQTNPTFTGPRVEATLGYDHTGAGSSVSNNNGRDDQKIDGLLYGGGIGYDIATSSNIVLGAEAELTGSTAKSDRNDYTSDFGYGRVKQGRDIYVGARAGYVVAPATMLYVKGGYTNSKLEVLAGSTSQTNDNSFKLNGWRVGAGAEHAVGPNSYAKLEYRYSNYERGNIDYAAGGTSQRFDVDTDRHQVVASYGFRF